MDPSRTISWEFFMRQYERLSFLPGFERVKKRHWAEFYRLFCEGWFPHEMEQAVSWVLENPESEFFPPPGKLTRLMTEHRQSIGGRDWDSTLAALEAEVPASTIVIGKATPAERIFSEQSDMIEHSDEPNTELLRRLGAGDVGTTGDDR